MRLMRASKTRTASCVEPTIASSTPLQRAFAKRKRTCLTVSAINSGHEAVAVVLAPNIAALPDPASTPLDAHAEIFDLQKFIHSIFGTLAAEAGRLDAAKRCLSR